MRLKLQSRKRRRYKDDGCIRARFPASFFDGVKHVEPFVLRAAFPGGDAADNLRAIFDSLKCVERTFPPGETLHNQPRIFVYKYTHIF